MKRRWTRVAGRYEIVPLNHHFSRNSPAAQPSFLCISRTQMLPSQFVANLLIFSPKLGELRLETPFRGRMKLGGKTACIAATTALLLTEYCS
ncbi:hypothetical protein J6590_035997 [Homalodisca vitripennis]|nr:hypothetical protein J6590_035997 [Homalodisca vitripennis]